MSDEAITPGELTNFLPTEKRLTNYQNNMFSKTFRGTYKIRERILTKTFGQQKLETIN